MKTEKALAALDAMATIWAAKIDLPSLVRAVLAAPADSQQEKLTALVKQAHVEGLYEGRTSHESEPRKPELLDIPAQREAVCRAWNNTPQELRQSDALKPLWQALRWSHDYAKALREPITFSDSVVREKGRLMHTSGRSYAGQWNEITHLAAEFGRASYLKGWRAAERAHNKNQKENP